MGSSKVILGGFPSGSDGKEYACNAGEPGLDPWVKKIPWRSEQLPNSSILAWRIHGWRSLVGYSSWGCKEKDTTE